jgi:hypothetical protein
VTAYTADALLMAIREKPSKNWLAKWMKDGEQTDIEVLYERFQQRLLARARQLSKKELWG